jgi:hemerythrin
MPVVDLDAIPQVALPFINHDHREEARLLNDLADAITGHEKGQVSVETVLHRFEALFEHTQVHFGLEEEAMQKAGFPPYPVHKGEHVRVLEEMEAEEVHFRETGDTARLRAYVTEGVPAWFIQHIQSMDAVTAQFVAMRQGG